MAAPTSAPTTRRVASIKGMSESELRRRRALGDVSCAECRRCRIRCDKKVPCGSCTRRGCVTLCPNGTLTAGKGARFVLSDTRELHEHIMTMSQRIRRLEDALETATNQDTAWGTHPLLSDDLLAIKFGPGSRTNRELSMDPHEDGSETDRSLSTPGSLFRGHDGSTTYSGPSGGSETVLPVGDESIADHVGGVASYRADNSSPLISDGHNYQDRMYMLMESLPDSAKVSALCESYINNYTWFFRPLSRDELFQELLMPILLHRNPGGHSDASQSFAHPHGMAVLFFIFAIAASMDQSHAFESDKYYRLGRIALSMHSVFDSPRMDTIQAVSLMAAYITNSDGKHAVEEAWSYLGIAIRLAISIGLHREPAKLDSQCTRGGADRRRRLFWELYALEINHCLVLGRPSCISACYIDCKLPTPEVTPGESGKSSLDLWDIKYHLARDVYTLVLEHVLKTGGVKYSEIVKLTQKLRDVTPATFNSLLSSQRPHQSSSLMLNYLCSQYQFHTVLLLHKPAIAAALLENPADTLSTGFAQSLILANRCASFLTHTLMGQFEINPELYHRFWFPWVQGFCAAMVSGSIGLRSPGCPLAGNAIGDLSAMVELFQKGEARGCGRAATALPYLVRLREKALDVYAKVERNSSVDRDPHGFSDCGQGRDVIAFAGHPAVVSFDEASYIWKVPQQGTMDQEYENLATRAPLPTPSPDLNAEFRSMVRIASSSSSPFRSLPTTPNPAANSTSTQVHMSSWIPTEGVAPPFDSCGNVYDDGTLHRGAYIPVERDAESQWNTFLLSAGTLPGSSHDSFQ